MNPPVPDATCATCPFFDKGVFQTAMVSPAAQGLRDALGESPHNAVIEVENLSDFRQAVYGPATCRILGPPRETRESHWCWQHPALALGLAQRRLPPACAEHRPGCQCENDE